MCALPGGKSTGSPLLAHIARHLDRGGARLHDFGMRTTVTLEPDVASRLKRYARRKRTSLESALNALLHRALGAQKPGTSLRRRFVVEPHSGGFKPGLDPGKLDQLVDQLETEDFIRETRAEP